MPFKKFSHPYKSKEYLDTRLMGAWRKASSSHTHKAFLEPSLHNPEVIYIEVHMASVFVELLKVDDKSPLMRSSLRFRYCKI